MDIKKAKEFRDFHKAEYLKYLDRTAEAQEFLNSTEQELKTALKAGDKAVASIILAHCNDRNPLIMNTEVFVHFHNWTVEIQVRVLDSAKNCDTDFRWGWKYLVIPIDDIPGLMEKGLTGENLEKYYVNEEN